MQYIVPTGRACCLEFLSPGKHGQWEGKLMGCGVFIWLKYKSLNNHGHKKSLNSISEVRLLKMMYV
jgi:hypothetical protein